MTADVDLFDQGIDRAYIRAHAPLMTTQQANALRNQINHLAAELESCKTKAETRCIKQTIRSAEERLSRG